MNVHEDQVAQPSLGFCMQSGSCFVADYIWNCFFSTRWDLENKEPVHRQRLGDAQQQPRFRGHLRDFWGPQPKTLSPGYTRLTSIPFPGNMSLPSASRSCLHDVSCVLCVSTCVVVCEPSGPGLVALMLGSGGFRPFSEPQAVMALSPLLPSSPRQPGHGACGCPEVLN